MILAVWEIALKIAPKKIAVIMSSLRLFIVAPHASLQLTTP